MHYADSCNALILSFYNTDDEFFSTQPAGCDWGNADSPDRDFKSHPNKILFSFRSWIFLFDHAWSWLLVHDVPHALSSLISVFFYNVLFQNTTPKNLSRNSINVLETGAAPWHLILRGVGDVCLFLFHKLTWTAWISYESFMTTNCFPLWELENLISFLLF